MPAPSAAKPRQKHSKGIQEARPSASVLLISPTNQILLLHRVRTSSAFPSAHVFPGGNVSSFHDGAIPAVDAPERHRDGEAYRVAAIRETFEESGILLAKSEGEGDNGGLLEVEQEESEKGRKDVHTEEVVFGEWVGGRGGRIDTDGLIPFTRWVTPPNLPRRFTTQMYLYFLPLFADTTTIAPTASTTPPPTQKPTQTHLPTPDGGLEHTAASFAHPSTWLHLADTSSIILFPPQYFLLHLISPFLPAPANDTVTATNAELKAQRDALQAFLKTSEPPWGEKCISPIQIGKRKSDGRAILGLDKPGWEFEGKPEASRATEPEASRATEQQASPGRANPTKQNNTTQRKGETDRVVLVNFAGRGGPRNVEVRWRKDVLEEERRDAASGDAGGGGDGGGDGGGGDGRGDGGYGPSKL